jgi:hypothetical protein
MQLHAACHFVSARRHFGLLPAILSFTEFWFETTTFYSTFGGRIQAEIKGH